MDIEPFALYSQTFSEANIWEVNECKVRIICCCIKFFYKIICLGIKTLSSSQIPLEEFCCCLLVILTASLH